MLELFVCLTAYYVVGGIGSRKGYGVFGPGSLAAASFPFGEAFGVGMGAMGLLEPLGWHEEFYSALGQEGFTVGRWSYIPVSAELTDPAVFIPSGLGFLAVGLIASYYVFVPALSRTVEVRRTSSVPFIPLGVLLILSGLSTYVFIQPKGGLIQAVLGQTALGLGVLCFYLQRRAHAPSTKDVTAYDSRPPALYLRGFAAEHLFAQPKRSWFPELVGRYVTFDEFLKSAISEKIGPLIALGRPDDVLPTLGAAREYVSDERWFEVFREWVGKARCLLVLPSTGTGLEEELAYICRADALEKTFIVIPPPVFGATDSRVLEAWSKLAAALSGHVMYMEQIQPEPGQLIAFGPKHSAYVAGRKLDSPSDYVRTIESVFQQRGGSPVEGQGLQLERAKREEAHAHAISDRWLRRGAAVRKGIRRIMGQKVRSEKAHLEEALDPAAKVVRWVAIAMFLHGLFNTVLAFVAPSELLPLVLGSSIIVIICAFSLAVFKSRVAAGAAALFYAAEFLSRSPYSFVLPWWGERPQNGALVLLITAMFVATLQGFLAAVRLRRKYRGAHG